MKGDMRMLKKQTVWLLMMLSLMIVLSVYYMMSDQEDVAYIDTEQQPFEEAVQEEEEAEDVVIENMTEVDHDELFTTIRMEDRKSTRLNSSHVAISYAVFCLNKTSLH